jgi:hypothetical protein
MLASPGLISPGLPYRAGGRVSMSETVDVTVELTFDVVGHTTGFVSQ